MAARSAVIDYFEIPESTAGNYKAKCKLCLSMIAASGKTTSNFVTHMKRKHPFVLNQPENKKTASEPHPKPAATTSALRRIKKYSTDDPRQLRMNDCITSFVSGTFQSPAVVESDEFHTMISALDPRVIVPTEQHLSTVLVPVMVEKIHQNLVKKLEHVKEVSITIDIGSIKQTRKYIAISAHFHANWLVQSAMLCYKKSTSCPTSDDISQLYGEIVGFYGIREKVTHIIVSNSSVTVHSINIPGFDKQDDGGNTLGKLCLSEPNWDDTTSEDAQPGQSDEESFGLFASLPKYQSCFAYTLQLIVKDGLQNIGNMSTIVSKASKIITQLQKSVLAAENPELFKQLQDTSTWNSQLKLILYILDMPENTLEELNLELSLRERYLLNGLCEILNSFASATDFTHRDKAVTSSIVIPCIIGLKVELDEARVKYSSNNVLNKLINSFQESMNTRLSPYESNNNLKMAAFLDPHFKEAWCQEDDKCHIRTMIQDEANLTLQNSETPPNNSDEVAPVPSKKARLLSYMADVDGHVKADGSKHSVVIDEELKLYLSEPCLPESDDPLKFWESRRLIMPILTQIAMKYLAIPSTCARFGLFGKSGGRPVSDPSDGILTDNEISAYMFIKNNKAVNVQTIVS